MSRKEEMYEEDKAVVKVMVMCMLYIILLFTYLFPIAAFNLLIAATLFTLIIISSIILEATTESL